MIWNYSFRCSSYRIRVVTLSELNTWPGVRLKILSLKIWKQVHQLILNAYAINHYFTNTKYLQKTEWYLKKLIKCKYYMNWGNANHYSLLNSEVNFCLDNLRWHIVKDAHDMNDKSRSESQNEPDEFPLLFKNLSCVVSTRPHAMPCIPCRLFDQRRVRVWQSPLHITLNHTTIRQWEGCFDDEKYFRPISDSFLRGTVVFSVVPELAVLPLTNLYFSLFEINFFSM